MATPFLATKVVTCSTISGATVCGSILYWQEIKDFLSLSKLTYLVQQVDTLPTNDLSNDASTKNLKCKTKKEHENIDLNCNLFKIPLNDKSFFNLTNLKNDDFQKIQTKSDIVAKDYYKLTFSSKIMDKNVDEIQIYSGDNHEKQIATLKLILKWDRSRIWGETTYVLGKAKNATNNASTHEVECLFDVKEKPFECTVSKFSSSTKDTKIEDLDFKNLSASASSDNFTEDNFYVVKIKSHNVLDLKNMAIFKKPTDTSTTPAKRTAIVELHDVQPLFGNINEDKKCFFLSI